MDNIYKTWKPGPELLPEFIEVQTTPKSWVPVETTTMPWRKAPPTPVPIDIVPEEELEETDGSFETTTDALGNAHKFSFSIPRISVDAARTISPKLPEKALPPVPKTKKPFTTEDSRPNYSFTFLPMTSTSATVQPSPTGPYAPFISQLPAARMNATTASSYINPHVDSSLPAMPPPPPSIPEFSPFLPYGGSAAALRKPDLTKAIKEMTNVQGFGSMTVPQAVQTVLQKIVRPPSAPVTTTLENAATRNATVSGYHIFISQQ